MTDQTPVAPKPRAVELPVYVAPKRFVQLFGISRPQVYRHLARGDFRAVKNGKTTLIDVQHARAFLESRPAAVFRVPNQKTAA